VRPWSGERQRPAPDDDGVVASSAAPPGRELAAVLLVTAAGGGSALLAASQAWLRLDAPRTPPLPPLAAVLTGRDVDPLIPALGVVGLAGLVALLATRRWGRLAVGILLTAAGVGLALRSLPHLAAPTAADARALLLDQGRATGEPPGAAVEATVTRVWPVVATFGGLALLAGGLITVLRSRRWPGMSARYDRPAVDPSASRTAGSPTPQVPDEPPADAVWDALDRGLDPTAAQRSQPAVPGAPARDSAAGRRRAGDLPDRVDERNGDVDRERHDDIAKDQAGDGHSPAG
jgi:uncharacterized membrane protein (TIGR02234 family)